MGRPQTTRRILSGSRSINAGWVQGPAPTDSDQDSYRGERAYLGKGLWSRRLTEPALQPADLLPLDAVVLSHLHGDHFDRIARRERVARFGGASTSPVTRSVRHGDDGRGAGARPPPPVPRMAVPVHYDDYRVFRSPLSEFLSLVGHDEEDWRIEPPDQRARLSVELAPAAGGTLLMLTHHDVPRTLGMSYRELWQQRLRRLTEHLGVEGVPATGEVTTGRHVRHVQGYPGAEWKEWTMADSKSTQQTTEEHPGQTLTTTDHDVIRD